MCTTYRTSSGTSRDVFDIVGYPHPPKGTDVNAALRNALAAAQLTETDVATHLGVDPKTVRRWLSGQRPYPRHRWALAELLQTNEGVLWPSIEMSNEKGGQYSTQLSSIFAHRWQVPRAAWVRLFEEAKEKICVLAYSGLFMADDAGILNIMRSRAREGVSVRIILGDPESTAVKCRGREEGVDRSVSDRSKNSLMIFSSLLDLSSVEVRKHGTALYNSVYFTEARMLVNHHSYGLPAGEGMVIDLNRRNSPDLFSVYEKSFNDVWEISTGEI